MTTKPPAVLAIGASAGGVDALRELVSRLPENFEAAVLVVLHVSATSPSVLPDLLSRAGPLPARHAVDGTPVASASITVAPPGAHMTVRHGYTVLSHGPRVNNSRPSIDVLFSSVAEEFGARAMAAVLSGMLDDGSAGLAEVMAAGGTGWAQDPSEAAFPAMPSHAASQLPPTQVLPLRLLAKAMVAHVDRLAESGGGGHQIRSAAAPASTSAGALAASESAQDGAITALNCPDCGGALWEGTGGDLKQFHCRVGHTYSPESLAAGQFEALERALWAAVVALEERGDLFDRLQGRIAGSGHDSLARSYAEAARTARREARVVRAAIASVAGAPAEGPVPD